MSETAPFERFPYARQLVVGVLRDEQALQAALNALDRAGVSPENREVLHGADERARYEVADALRAAGSEFVDYYGDNYIESLDLP